MTCIANVIWLQYSVIGWSEMASLTWSWLSAGPHTSRRLAWASSLGRWAPKAARERARTNVQVHTSAGLMFASFCWCKQVTHTEAMGEGVN